jgi:hypothetical protein
MIYFEKAVMNVLSTTFPNASLTRRYFKGETTDLDH